MSFSVRFAPDAEADLDRLFEFLLERAESVADLTQTHQVMSALRNAVMAQLAVSPFSPRKAGKGLRSTRREPIIPAGRTGYVALYEIDAPRSVLVLALRDQREEDHH